jgi:hypothetical protein
MGSQTARIRLEQAREVAGPLGIAGHKASLSFGGAIAPCRRDAEICARLSNSLPRNGGEESSGRAVEVATHTGMTGWHWEKAVYARKCIADATVGLNHFLCK